MGSIIGVGIFSLPYAIASYGPISLVAMGLATVGAVALAFMFAVLSRRIPAEGGPYAYARAAFGNGFGFSQAWLYWITAWAGNAAIAVGWVFYVEKFVNKGGSTLGGRSSSPWSASGSPRPSTSPASATWASSSSGPPSSSSSRSP